MLATFDPQTALDAAVEQITRTMRTSPKDIAEHHFELFCSYYLGAHFDFGFATFQYDLFDEIKNIAPGRSYLYLFPREHGKTTLWTFAYVLWNMLYRKKRHIGIFSAVTGTSEKFLANIKAEITNNPLIVQDFGVLIPEEKKNQRRSWKSSHIRTANHVVVTAGSTGTAPRGTIETLPVDLENVWGLDEDGNPVYRMKSTRFDLLIGDDLLDDKKVMTKEARDRTWAWFWQALVPAQQMGEGNIILVGTTIHSDDLMSRLWEDKTQTRFWRKRMFPACNPDKPFDEHGNPVDCLFPERWGKLDYSRPMEVVNPETGALSVEYRSFLWHRAQELGPLFGPEFLLRPIDVTMRFFDESNYGWYHIPAATPPGVDMPGACMALYGKALEALPADLICVSALDPAGTDAKQARNATSDPDWTAIVTAGYSQTTRKFYTLAVSRGRYKPGEMLAHLIMHYQLFSRDHGAMYVPDPANPRDVIHGLPFQHLGLVLETVAFQKVLSGMLSDIAVALGITPIVYEAKRGAGTGKLMRAMLPAALVQQGSVMFPFQTPGTYDPAMQALFDELRVFPSGSSHDDVTDALTDTLHVLHMFSLGLGRGFGGAQIAEQIQNSRYGINIASGDVSQIVAALERAGDPMSAARPASDALRGRRTQGYE